MIAHSFRGKGVPAPAQRLHGATYVVDLEFRRSALDANGMVVDIGLATECSRRRSRASTTRNLDEGAGVHGTQHDDEVSRARDLRARRVAAIGRGELGAGASGVEVCA